jgi:quercetin dioxygenase-like cupin family protein
MYRTELARGLQLTKHVHSYDHVSILAKGVAIVTQNDVSTLYFAGDHITITAGAEHTVKAVDDVVWFCLHVESEIE